MNRSSLNPANLDGPAVEISSRPLKVLLVVEPGIAGVFGHVDGLARYLVEQGQHVSLAYSDKRNGPNLPPLLDFIRQQGGKCLNLKVGNAPSPHDPSAFVSLLNFARENAPDIIHSHSSKAGVLARALAPLGIKSPQFYTPNAYYGLASRRDLREKFYNKIEAVLGNIGQTITVSEDERKFAVEELHVDPARCLLIPLTVDATKFSPPSPEQKKKARDKFNLSDDTPVLGWMGRLSYQKDPETLYRALGLMLKGGKKKWHLLQVGQGEGRDRLEQIVRENDLKSHITHIEYLQSAVDADPNTVDFYHAVDGLILNSRYEGCPTTALEALSSDVPLILSRAPGTSWLTKCDLSHCWSAATGDAAGFAEAISLWANDLPNHRPVNHRAFANKRFSIAETYGAILKAYRAQAANQSR